MESPRSAGVRSDGAPVPALTAGFGLVAMTCLAVFANVAVTRLLDAARAGEAVGYVGAHQGLLRFAVVAFYAVAALDVVVAWALGTLLAPVHRGLAQLSAWLRVVYAAGLIAAVANLLTVLRAGARTTGAATSAGGGEQVSAAAFAFKDGWSAALAVFGVHLLLVGVLAWRSTQIPRWLAVLLGLAGAGYLVDGLGSVLVADYSLDVAAFTFVGEALLMVWLLWRGRRLAGLTPRGAGLRA